MSIRAIAQALGLSPSAVSLALRNSPKVASSTREKVLEQAQRLAYRPNAKYREAMSHLRLGGVRRREACLGVISFYDYPRPWEHSLHLQHIFEAMKGSADLLGYRLEPFWLKEPGLSLRRLRIILETRGIQGLLCFGSPQLDEVFPAELGTYAVVTVGLSIATPLHRVTSHFYNDLTQALNRVHALGYRRPGLVLGVYEECRSAHAYSSAYFGWCEHTFGTPQLLPVLRLEHLEEGTFLDWYQRHQPDAILFVHLYDQLHAFRALLDKNGIRTPEDVGVAAVSQILEGSSFAGMEQNARMMGRWALELLVSRLHHLDFGLPAHPRIEMVESHWVEGSSLRPQVPSEERRQCLRQRSGETP